MTDAEILAVFGGLIAGYWLVNRILAWKDKQKPSPTSRPTGGEPQAPGPASRVPPWHQVLMVSQSASFEEIKAAYKDQIRQYHPDKVANMGPELRDIAERKSKEINVAYQAALRERGSRG